MLCDVQSEKEMIKRKLRNENLKDDDTQQMVDSPIVQPGIIKPSLELPANVNPSLELIPTPVLIIPDF